MLIKYLNIIKNNKVMVLTLIKNWIFN
jgi:hypothetical protein